MGFINRYAHLIYRWVKAKYMGCRLAFLSGKSPVKIVVGAGGASYKGWTLTDIGCLDLLKPKDWERYFSESSIDAILAEHVWEHLSIEDGIKAAETCYKYIKQRGYLRIAVPDGLHPDREYIEIVRPGGIGGGAEDHKVLYSYRTFKDVFEKAGFSVTLLEYFDEDGNFHYQEWSPDDGIIRRSSRYDKRNADGVLRYTSIIIDAYKN